MKVAGLHSRRSKGKLCFETFILGCKSTTLVGLPLKSLIQQSHIQYALLLICCTISTPLRAYIFNFFIFIFRDSVSLCHLLTITSNSSTQAVLSPQPPKVPGLQACVPARGLAFGLQAVLPYIKAILSLLVIFQLHVEPSSNQVRQKGNQLQYGWIQRLK